MITPRALIMTGFGINCQDETAAACRTVGMQPDIAHMQALLTGHMDIHDYDCLIIPGGFSFGDDLGSGQVLAARICHQRNHRGKTLLAEMERFLGDRKPIVGICNGFQVLLRTPLFGAEIAANFSLALNSHGSFDNRWVRLTVPSGSRSLLFKNLPSMELPVRHGEGRIVAKSWEDMERMIGNGQACLFYADENGLPTEEFPFNPNGSWGGCAALCDTTGLVTGMMPHPEAALTLWNHPEWPRKQRQAPGLSVGDGVVLFHNILLANERNIKHGTAYSHSQGDSQRHQ